MKSILGFLKERRAEIHLFAGFVFIFTLVLYLYGISISLMTYPVLLCFTIGTIYTAAAFIKTQKHNNTLKQITDAEQAHAWQMPEALCGTEKELLRIIDLLIKDAETKEELLNKKYRDTEELYTLWAHQIKTPIATMKLNLQNEDSDFSRKLSYELGRIEQYTEMALAIIRLDSPSKDYVFRELEVDDVVKEAVKKFSSEFILKKIKLDYTPANFKTISDEKWLVFVLEQILSNALKYTKTGSVQIYAVPNKKLCIKDSGIGISPEDLPRIFEKGYTGYNGRADKKASGLGLYLCRKICDELGINLEVSSEIGKGTLIIMDMQQYKLQAE